MTAGAISVFLASLFFILLAATNSSAFSLSCNMASSKDIYNVPNSGWKSPQWNWGSARGTGHDCALICRNRYGTRDAREQLVQNLKYPKNDREPPFEEVKLVLGLAWQRGRWDGTDGGRGGYGDVLAQMAKAERYEDGSEEDCSRLLIQDMSERFHLLAPTEENEKEMQLLLEEYKNNVDVARRKCAGLVLDAMGFVDSGL